MDSVSSDTDDEADSGDQEEAKEVSLKSKLAPRYDDEEDNEEEACGDTGRQSLWGKHREVYAL